MRYFCSDCGFVIDDPMSHLIADHTFGSFVVDTKNINTFFAINSDKVVEKLEYYEIVNMLKKI